MIRKEEVKPDNGRVTAGIPSLDSPKRFEKDSAIATDEYLTAVEQEKEQCEARCIAPDAERPTTVLGASEGVKLTAVDFMRKLTAMNNNLWFERSKSIPTEIMCCLLVAATLDHPDGIWFQFGFSGVRPQIEWNWVHEKKRMVHTREGFLKEEKYACHGCQECNKEGAFYGRIRGWRSCLQILLNNRVITATQITKHFGSPSKDSKNWQTVMNGS